MFIVKPCSGDGVVGYGALQRRRDPGVGGSAPGSVAGPGSDATGVIFDHRGSGHFRAARR